MDANDRERERMGKLNTAFNSLRHLLPKHGNDRELSKFETVQIAKNYIRALNQMLSEASEAEKKREEGQQLPQLRQGCGPGELTAVGGQRNGFHYNTTL